MAKPAIPDIDLNATDFDTAHGILALEKSNYDENGELVGPLPDSAAQRGVTAELMNLVDNLVRKYQRRLSGTVRNVVEFGATGDGTTDDTAAIQAAIDVGAGVVYFPPGTYLVTALTRPGGVTLQGAGDPHTRIRAAAPTAAIIDSPVSSYSLSPSERRGGVKAMRIDGTSRDSVGGVGISLAGCYDAVIEDVTFENLELGLLLTHSAYWNNIKRCRFAVVDRPALVTNNSNENLFTGCHVLSCERGFSVEEGADRGVSNVTFDFCAVEQSTDSAYYIEATNPIGVDGVKIREPRIERAANLAGVAGVELVGEHRNVSVIDPLLVNIDTPVTGAREDTVLRWRAQDKNGLRFGELGNWSVTSHALLNFLAGRAHLRDAENDNYVDLHLATLWLANGPRVTSISAGTNGGDPNGQITAGQGSWCLSGNGLAYRKTTASGNTGWVAVGDATHYESFGFDTATSSTDVWASFGPHLVETAQTNAPRAYHVWRVPRAGTVSTITLTAEDDPGVTTCEFYQPDGTTAVGSVSDAGVAAVVSGTSGADTLYEVTYNFSTPVTLTAGQHVLLAIDIASNLGEVFGHIELGT